MFNSDAMAGSPTLRTANCLYSAVAKDERKTNFVLSPFSILGVFHMAQRGAKGDMKKEMDELVAADTDFRLPPFSRREEDGTPTVIVEVANRLYAAKSLEGNKCFEGFSAKLEASMGSDGKTIDFAQSQIAAREINEFIKQKTRDHITNLVDPSMLNEATRLLLVNALYFKAPWSSQFRREATCEGAFHARTSKGLEEQPVKFMRQHLKRGFRHIQEAEVTAFSMNYTDDRLSMCVYMPEAMDLFEAKVSAEPEYLEELASRLRNAWCGDKELMLAFPKFRLSASDNSIDLVAIFRELGMTMMFEPNLADFSGISGRRDLSISGYVHQADIDVDEEGTEATAATALFMSTVALMLPKPVVTLSINKPFLFQIRFEEEERSPHILFCGRIIDVATAQ